MFAGRSDDGNGEASSGCRCRMRSSWTVLFVAVALFLAALAQAPGRQVESAYRDWLQLQASGDVQRIASNSCSRPRSTRPGVSATQGTVWLTQGRVHGAGARVPATGCAAEFRRDGTQRSPGVVAGTCTLYAWEAGFDRLEDGGWVYARAHESWGDAPTCRERDGIPVRGDPRVPWPPVR
jgi:hypothetical protein